MPTPIPCQWQDGRYYRHQRPRACNLVTGLATAMMEFNPLSPSRARSAGPDRDGCLQRGPHHRIAGPDKHASIVMDIKDLAQTIYEAFHIASTGRPGPVLIDIPVDVECRNTASVVNPDQPAGLTDPATATRARSARRPRHQSLRKAVLLAGAV